MKTSTIRNAMITIAVVSVFSLTGCVSTSTPEPSPTVIGSMNQVIAPVTVNVEDLQGALVELDKGNTINIVVKDSTVASWKAEIKNSKIAEFTSGSDEDDLFLNPSLKGLEKGTTEVKLYNDVNDVTFTVQVN